MSGPGNGCIWNCRDMTGRYGGHTMGIFDKFRKKNSDPTIEEIISRYKNYQQKYFDECQYIWTNYVPAAGQADNLQGELLREVEKIRCEAQDNGNINWDDDFSYFCDFITKSLSEQPIFSKDEKQEIAVIMNYFKECGYYSQKFHRGEIPDSDFQVEKIAYVDDDLYDVISDKIGQMQRENSGPIPYKRNDNLRR